MKDYIKQEILIECFEGLECSTRLTLIEWKAILIAMDKYAEIKQNYE